MNALAVCVRAAAGALRTLAVAVEAAKDSGNGGSAGSRDGGRVQSAHPATVVRTDTLRRSRCAASNERRRADSSRTLDRSGGGRREEQRSASGSIQLPGE